MPSLAKKKARNNIADTQRVRSIFGPGVYHFFIGTDPDFSYYSIPEHIQKTFPKIVAKIFEDADLNDGEYTRAKLRTEKDWSQDVSSGGVFLILKKQYCEMKGYDSSSNGGSWGNFEVEDIGRVSIARNKLVISGTDDLDGKVSMHYSGTVPHFRTGGSKSSDYKVKVTGRNPGDVVLATIDFINSELRRTDNELYKE
jgi:hypothetical protein